LEGPIPKAYCNGFLAVGDAASQVKSTTGGGVVFGLTCAEVAAKVAYEAVRKGDVSEEFLSTYGKEWKRLVGFDLRAMNTMRRMLNSLSDSRTDKIFGLANRLGIEKVLEKFGDIDFQGRSLLPMMRYPSTVAVVGYFLFSWLTSSTRQ
jgi:flavin-dependent dehydrogenase